MVIMATGEKSCCRFITNQKEEMSSEGTMSIRSTDVGRNLYKLPCIMAPNVQAKKVKLSAWFHQDILSFHF